MEAKIKVQLEKKERLDVFLSRFYDMTRSQVQKQLKARTMEVNGKPATGHTKLNDGDELIISEALVKPKKEVVEPPPFPEVLFEDDNVVVINKPAGLKVHESHELDNEPALSHAIAVTYPEMQRVGDEPELRPGMVHRLDKDASGIMVLARNQNAFNFLKKQFKERTLKKFYTVLVYGSPTKEHDQILLRIDRSKRKGHMAAYPEDSERGRSAHTEYDVVERFATTSLLRVRIHTGRTHQIRVHFLSIDHPVVGDKLYRKRQMKNIREIDLGRLFLHASELTFTLPSGEETTITAPLPEPLTQLLEDLRN